MADLEQEQRLWQAGLDQIAGVDEVGRGPLAGPVLAAAVVFAPDFDPTLLQGLTDSKKLSARQRERLAPLIQEQALAYGIGIVSAGVIDRINILQATFLAMRRALAHLPALDHILVDGNKKIPYLDLPQTAIIKGDLHSLSIAAASVLAKTARDALMCALAQHYPGYGLERHMGYPTAFHRLQVQQLGLSPQHRRTFCSKILEASA